MANPQLWACALGQPAADPVAHPLEVSGVGAHLGFQVWAPILLIWVHANQASGVCWGCLSCVHIPGAEGVGAQEATAAVESSLTSR